MRSDREQAIFSNRYDAGRKLAAKLVNYKGKPVVVLAVPNGGLPVALEVALLLEAELDLVISRKLPLPLTPEAGFGAVGDDGTVILNDEVVDRIGLSPYQVNYQVNKVKSEIQQRSMLYREYRSVAVVNGRTAIIIDDGLASGLLNLDDLRRTEMFASIFEDLERNLAEKNETMIRYALVRSLVNSRSNCAKVSIILRNSRPDGVEVSKRSVIEIKSTLFCSKISISV